VNGSDIYDFELDSKRVVTNKSKDMGNKYADMGNSISVINLLIIRLLWFSITMRPLICRWKFRLYGELEFMV